MTVPNLDWQQQPDLLCSNIVSPYREADRFRSISVQPGKNYRSTQRKKPCRPGRSAITSAVIHNEGNYKPGRGDSR
jgi:hypothetical protein